MSNPEGSRFSPIRKGHISPKPQGSVFANPEESYFFLPIWRVLLFANLEVSYFCQCEGVIFFCQTGTGLMFFFANPEGSQFSQSGEVPVFLIRKGPFLPTRKSLSFFNPEGSKFCQSGRVSFLPIKSSPVFAYPVESKELFVRKRKQNSKSFSGYY